MMMMMMFFALGQEKKKKRCMVLAIDILSFEKAKYKIVCVVSERVQHGRSQ
jgi:hypothetical protein